MPEKTPIFKDQTISIAKYIVLFLIAIIILTIVKMHFFGILSDIMKPSDINVNIVNKNGTEALVIEDFCIT